ncbi:MAG: FtsX-like permease family protein [Bacteroidota bacterium]
MKSREKKIPRFPFALLRWLCKPDYFSDIAGDLEEFFWIRVREKGYRRAKRHLLKDVILLLRPGIIRIGFPKNNYLNMFKHTFKITFRNFSRNKSSVAIKLISLTTGLTSLLLIYLWVLDEYQVNRFFQSSDRLVQVLQNEFNPNGVDTDESTPAPLANALMSDLPEIERAVAVVPYEWFEGEKLILTDSDSKFLSSKNIFAGREFFNIFSFELIRGQREEVLSKKNTVVISQQLAENLFNSTDVVGNELEWIHDDYGGKYIVTGVFRKPPENVTMKFDAAFSYQNFMDSDEDLSLWTESDPNTYALLKDASSLATVNSKLTDYLKSKNEHINDQLFGQLLSTRYLYGTYADGIQQGGRIQYVKLFVLIAIFILLIASVNFMNQSTAKASNRMKEIGVKKTMGASRNALAFQYLVESLMLTIFSLLIAVILTILLLPYFNLITAKSIQFQPDFFMLGSLLAVALVTGLISGSYPALFLSGHSPVDALKGKRNINLGEKGIRKGLIVFQFVIAIILISGVMVVYKQVDLIQSKNLGYNKEQIIAFNTSILQSGADTDRNISEKGIEMLLQRLKNTTGVVNASNFAHNIIGDYGTTTDLSWPGMEKNQTSLFANVAAGYDFIETMEIKLKSGRSFDRAFSTDHEKIIFNETAIRKMGLTDPIGKKVNLWGQEREIIGVVEDFHFDKLYQKIEPLFINLTTGSFASQIMVKIGPKNQKATLGKVEEVFKSFFVSGLPFEFRFLDDHYQELYAQEIRTVQLLKYFTLVAILISCLGLYGMAAFVAEQRNKEIGIRKVLGANFWGVVKLITGSFTGLVLISIIIALPVAAYLLQQWLEGFSYRIELSPLFFVMTALFTLIIAWVAIGFETVKVALSKPLDALKEE